MKGALMLCTFIPVAVGQTHLAHRVGHHASKYMIFEGCKYYNCPADYQAIMKNETCIEAIETLSPGGDCHNAPWKDNLHVLDVSDMPSGCYTVETAQSQGCSRLRLNAATQVSNVSCGGGFSTSLLCQRKCDDGFEALEDGTCVPVAPVDSEFMLFKGCEFYSCPEGFETIMSNETCIKAIETLSPGGDCHNAPWKDNLHVLDFSDMPSGCYTVETAQSQGCSRLRLNAATQVSNVSCGGGFSTSLLCQRKSHNVLV